MNLVWCNVLALALAGPMPDGTPPQAAPGEGDLWTAILGSPITVKPGMTRAQALDALKKDGYPIKEIPNHQADVWRLSKSAAPGSPIPGSVCHISVTFKGGLVEAAHEFVISN